MKEPALLEKRRQLRKVLTGLLPGRLTIKESGSCISCRPVNVSKNGLGILSSEILPIGAVLMLKTHNMELTLRIQWAQPDFSKENLYRYGLEVDNKDEDLEKIFISTGCLRDPK